MVNEYLLNRLFADLARDPVYDKWFPKIWGRPELFEKFLHLASTQSQKTVAQDIVRYMSCVSNFSIPNNVFTNLVEVEHQGDDWERINQEHAVHSVNVYICGIYLFFFYFPLRQQLLHYFLKLGGKSQHESPLDEAIGAAVQCIRIAALYHDIGYVLERTVDGNGYFDTQSGLLLDDLLVYNLLEQEVAYEITKKVVTHILFAQGIIGQSQNMLNDELGKSNWIQDDAKWLDLTSRNCVPTEIIKNKLSSLKNMVQLQYIHSWEGMKYLVPYLSCKDVLIIAKDAALRTVAICHGLTSTPEVYYLKKLKMDIDMLSHIGELGPEDLRTCGVTLTYYIPNKCAKLSEGYSHLEESIREISRCCRNRFSSDFGLLFSENEISQLLYKISEWIERKVPLDLFADKQSKFRTRQREIDNQLLTKIYQEKAAKIIGTQKMELLDPEGQVKKLGHAFLEEVQKDSFISALFREYNQISNTDPDTTCDEQLRECVRIIYQSIQDTLATKKKRGSVVKVIKYSKSKKNKIVFNGLEQNRFNEITTVKRLYRQLEQHLDALGLHWRDIKTYKHATKLYDHGKVSAGLLIEVYGIFSSVMEDKGNSEMFRCVWQTPEDIHALNKTYELKCEISEAIFAILMHNIWVKSENNPDGLNFIHDVSVNAMSYFLAFCDTLQFWDRDKLFDPAKQRQPESTYYGKDFDIYVEKSKVIVRCRTSGVKDCISSKLRGMDEFLKDAGSMLQVVECL